VNEHEREIRLERIDREGATVGASIPETITVDGTKHDLRAQVLDLAGEDPAESEVASKADELRIEVRGKRHDHVSRLEQEDISLETADQLVERIIGLDRALEVLRGVSDPSDIQAEIRRKERADAKRWRAFLERANGEDLDRGIDR